MKVNSSVFPNSWCSSVHGKSYPKAYLSIVYTQKSQNEAQLIQKITKFGKSHLNSILINLTACTQLEVLYCSLKFINQNSKNLCDSKNLYEMPIHSKNCLTLFENDIKSCLWGEPNPLMWCDSMASSGVRRNSEWLGERGCSPDMDLKIGSLTKEMVWLCIAIM